jgi:hypothetical protein
MNPLLAKVIDQILQNKILPLITNPSNGLLDLTKCQFAEHQFVIQVNRDAQILIQMISQTQVQITAQTIYKSKISYVTEKERVGVYVTRPTPASFQRIFDVSQQPFSSTTTDGILEAFHMALKEASTYEDVSDACVW